jgi:hypothetical protein
MVEEEQQQDERKVDKGGTEITKGEKDGKEMDKKSE